MSIKTALSLRKLKIELRCEICNCSFDQCLKIPKILSCGHTLCSKCLEKMNNKNIYRCPFDRRNFDIDPQSIATNYYILSLIDQQQGNNPVISLNDDFSEEEFALSPRTVINPPGWKQTLDGFIYKNVLYSVETNGYIYCTNLSNGEWWFLYHYQFFGKFFFVTESGNIYLIDQFGALYHLSEKNFYMQIGKKNAWKNTIHATVYMDKLYTIETPDKFYETNLKNGKWKEIVIKKEANETLTEIEERLFKHIVMLISNSNSIIFSNKYGEVFQFKEDTGETRLIATDFMKGIDSYSKNSTYVYFFEKKNPKIIYRTYIEEDSELFMKIEFYLDISKKNNDIYPNKIVVSETQMVIIDKKGYINLFMINDDNNKNSIPKDIPINTYQCLFILRNCHLMNTCLINEGDLLLLDPIRLSLNKLNIIAGTEVIILHSNKFLFTIKYIFSSNSKIYFIDVTGNLYYFNENDKKLSQIGINGICKYVNDLTIYKNFLLTIENNSIFKTDLKDGNFIEIPNEYCGNYEFFLCDNINVVFVTRNDEVVIYNFDKANQDKLILIKKFEIEGIAKNDAVTFFRRYIIYYNISSKSIEGVNIDDSLNKKIFIRDFPDVNMFICNNDFLACILRNGVIYKLFC